MPGFSFVRRMVGTKQGRDSPAQIASPGACAPESKSSAGERLRRGRNGEPGPTRKHSPVPNDDTTYETARGPETPLSIDPLDPLVPSSISGQSPTVPELAASITSVPRLEGIIESLCHCGVRIPEIHVQREAHLITSSLAYPTLPLFRPWCDTRDSDVDALEDHGCVAFTVPGCSYPDQRKRSAVPCRHCLTDGYAALAGEAVAAAASTVRAVKIHYGPCPSEASETAARSGSLRVSPQGQSARHTPPQFSPGGTRIYEGDHGCSDEPILVLLGGPSGTGKSTLAPLVTHLFLPQGGEPDSQPPHEEGDAAFGNGVSSQADLCGESCAVVSTDHTREVLRAVSWGRNSLLFRSTYELQAIASQQLQTSLECSDRPAACEAVVPGAGDHQTCGTGDVSCSNDRSGEQPQICLTKGEESAQVVRDLQSEIENNLDPFSSWFPHICPSCKERFPCPSVVGLLEQSVLLQRRALAPTIHSLMTGSRRRRPPCTRSSSSQPKREGEEGQIVPCGQGLRLVVVEGVHLTPAFVRHLQVTYGKRCVSFTVYLHSRDQHAARLQQRQDDGSPPTGSGARVSEASGREKASVHPALIQGRAEPPGETGLRGRSAFTDLTHCVPSTPDRKIATSQPSLELEVCGAVPSALPAHAPNPHAKSATSGSDVLRHPNDCRKTDEENKYLRHLCNIRCLQIYLCLAAKSVGGPPPEEYRHEAVDAVCSRFLSEALDYRKKLASSAQEKKANFVAQLESLAEPQSSGGEATYIIQNSDLTTTAGFLRNALVSEGICISDR